MLNMSCIFAVGATIKRLTKVKHMMRQQKESETTYKKITDVSGVFCQLQGWPSIGLVGKEQSA